jgi:hypothetical protein
MHTQLLTFKKKASDSVKRKSFNDPEGNTMNNYNYILDCAEYWLPCSVGITIKQDVL